MDIPLYFFLLTWLVLVGIFLLMSAVTLLMYLRFGMTGSTTFLSTLVFVSATAAMLFVSAGYLIGVDWSQSIHLGSVLPNQESY